MSKISVPPWGIFPTGKSSKSDRTKRQATNLTTGPRVPVEATAKKYEATSDKRQATREGFKVPTGRTAEIFHIGKHVDFVFGSGVNIFEFIVLRGSPTFFRGILKAH